MILWHICILLLMQFDAPSAGVERALQRTGGRERVAFHKVCAVSIWSHAALCLLLPEGKKKTKIRVHLQPGDEMIVQQ